MADFMASGTRHRKQFATYEEADAWQSELKKRIRLGIPFHELLDGKGDTLTLRALLEKTYSRFWEGSANERKQISNIKHLEAFFGEALPVSTITTSSLDELVSSMEKRSLAPSTINSRLSTLSKAMTFALDRHYITNRPKFEMKKTQGNQRLRFLTEEEEHDILDFLDSDGRHDFANFIRWSIDTGMRPIEARNVKQTAIRNDPELGWLVDLRKTKNCYPRTIPLTDRAYSAYQALADEAFPFARFTESSIKTNWKFVRGCFMDDDPDFVFYITRHTCASRLVQRKVPLQIVKEFMGHKTFDMTLRYAKLSPANMLDARQALQQSI